MLFLMKLYAIAECRSDLVVLGECPVIYCFCALSPVIGIGWSSLKKRCAMQCGMTEVI